MFQSLLSTTQEQVKVVFENMVNGFDHRLSEPMLYSVLGGKCLRAFLVLESAKIYGIPEDQALRVATAVEATHAYSLIHDDLPCMDNDNIRRGKPTVHIKWDEALAVLTGDALQALSFEILSSPRTSADPVVRLKLITTLSKAIGADGMVLGQLLDIEAENLSTPTDLDTIIRLQTKKTGALIKWSLQAGPLMAGEETDSLKRFAELLGLAFQIRDDILDLEGESRKVGKKLRKDYTAGKATFVSLLGLNGAKKKAISLINQSIRELETINGSTGNLKAAAQFVISRDL